MPRPSWRPSAVASSSRGAPPTRPTPPIRSPAWRSGWPHSGRIAAGCWAGSTSTAWPPPNHRSRRVHLLEVSRSRTWRRRMPDREQMMARQKVLAAFGNLALRSEDLDEVLTEACRLVGEALGTDLAKIMEIEPDRRCLLVRA